ncbi:GntR family transcriptional regulator [Acuticoccus kandeliae]|uniref:GntR family transcriptional regulator n=1 Tax=Acuticoccus kandeliae TaxID=2073160 RepID=UPI0013006CC6|nr:GntR family transcriptional regulator [Acuticoccus kandeliae]
MSDTTSSTDGEQALVERITSSVFSAILTGELPLGAKVREKRLAEQFGVSRGPLREAIRCLEGRGLIERTPNFGPRVVSLGTEDVIQIYVVREALEGMCCRLATELMSDKEIDALAELSDRHLREEKWASEPMPFEQDLDFHHNIIRAAKNVRLERIIKTELYDMLRIYRACSGGAPGRGKQAMYEHQAIVSAMAERDSALAEMLMRRHIRNSRMNLIRRINAEAAASEVDEAEPKRRTRAKSPAAKAAAIAGNEAG